MSGIHPGVRVHTTAAQRIKRPREPRMNAPRRRPINTTSTANRVILRSNSHRRTMRCIRSAALSPRTTRRPGSRRPGYSSEPIAEQSMEGCAAQRRYPARRLASRAGQTRTMVIQRGLRPLGSLVALRIDLTMCTLATHEMTKERHGRSSKLRSCSIHDSAVERHDWGQSQQSGQSLARPGSGCRL
jgi:hypothetical protein